MKTTIPIKGMHCPSCEVLITDVLAETDGVKAAKVSLAENAAHVEFDQSKVSEAQLRKAIEAEGYKTA
jgi:copper chaperone CopZ